jgi:predicted O-linked N-acetylglucosamine transferase (SPINDLY family)
MSDSLTSRDTLLRQAQAALSAGNAQQLLATCELLLTRNRDDLKARQLKGRGHAALGQWSQAVAEFSVVHTQLPLEPTSALDLGIAHTMSGRYREALAILQRVATTGVRPPGLHFALGTCWMGLGQLGQAEIELREAVRIDPRFADAHHRLGLVLENLGNRPGAIRSFRQAVTLRPQLTAAWVCLSDSLLAAGDSAEAGAALRQAIALRPEDALLRSKLGALLLSSGMLDEAAQELEGALALDARLAGAATNLGEALRRLGKPQDARRWLQHALAIDSGIAEAYLSLGLMAAAHGESAEAVAHLKQALRLGGSELTLRMSTSHAFLELGQPDQALHALPAATDSVEAEHLRGMAFHRLGQLDHAIDAYQRALALDPRQGEALLHLGQAMESAGRATEALESLERAATHLPKNSEVPAAILSCSIRICDWDRADQALTALRRHPDGIDAVHAFLLLSLDLGVAALAASLQRRGARLSRAQATSTRRHRTDGPLRIAYVSPDFREHPVAHALAGVIARHDPRRVLAFGLALRQPDSSAIARRLSGAFHRLLDVSSMGFSDIEQLTAQLDLDIAIDLGGHTAGARPELFGRRLAPVQIGYLGFPASTGLPTMDCIVADDIVIPRADEISYVERVLRMPHCYLPFDRDRDIAPTGMRRADVGLPAKGFVFCAFTNGYKLTRSLFSEWLGLMRALDGSVLWLRSMPREAEHHLRAAAEAAGLESERLIFAPYVANAEEHLARLQLADLFLDSLPYNAHSSAAEALWAGVPVLTQVGQTFAGRVGASLLSAVGLTELIHADAASYRHAALDLAGSPTRLREYRQRLREARDTATLFDTDDYTRAFESLLFAAADGPAPRS